MRLRGLVQSAEVMLPCEVEGRGLLARREGEALGLDLGTLTIGEEAEDPGELVTRSLPRRGADTAPVEEPEAVLRR